MGQGTPGGLDNNGNPVGGGNRQGPNNSHCASYVAYQFPESELIQYDPTVQVQHIPFDPGTRVTHWQHNYGEEGKTIVAIYYHLTEVDPAMTFSDDGNGDPNANLVGGTVGYPGNQDCQQLYLTFNDSQADTLRVDYRMMGDSTVYRDYFMLYAGEVTLSQAGNTPEKYSQCRKLATFKKDKLPVQPTSYEVFVTEHGWLNDIQNIYRGASEVTSIDELFRDMAFMWRFVGHGARQPVDVMLDGHGWIGTQDGGGGDQFRSPSGRIQTALDGDVSQDSSLEFIPFKTYFTNDGWPAGVGDHPKIKTLTLLGCCAGALGYNAFFGGQVYTRLPKALSFFIGDENTVVYAHTQLGAMIIYGERTTLLIDDYGKWHGYKRGKPVKIAN